MLIKLAAKAAAFCCVFVSLFASNRLEELVNQDSMEIIRGAVRLKDLFKSHWAAFFLSFFSMIARPAIVKNVMKVIHCCTNMLGFHLYECPSCGDQTKVPHSCKSRFCPSCGKKATEQWMNNAFKTLPDCKWQHITFTMPREFSELFRLNREVLFKEIPPIPNKLLIAQAKKKGIQPRGMPYMTIHTFGRSLNYNVHFHVSISMGGLTEKKENGKLGNGLTEQNTQKQLEIPCYQYTTNTLQRRKTDTS